MINEDEYEQKFSSLVNALQEARVMHETAKPENRQQALAEWQKIKDEFNNLIRSNRSVA